MKARQAGTCADWLLVGLKDGDQPVSVGCGTLTWHCAERELSYWMVLRSTSMNGMPANITTTIATNTRFSIRAALRTPLLPSSAPSARAFSHSCTTMATNGSRSEAHTSELQSIMRRSYAVFCLKKKNKESHDH